MPIEGEVLKQMLEKRAQDDAQAYAERRPVSRACPWCYQGNLVPLHNPCEIIFCEHCEGGLEYIESEDPLESNYIGPYKQSPNHPRKPFWYENPKPKPKNPNQFELF